MTDRRKNSSTSGARNTGYAARGWPARLALTLSAAALATAFAASAADIQSVSRIAFGPDNTIFVGDWAGSKVGSDAHLMTFGPTRGR